MTEHFTLRHTDPKDKTSVKRKFCHHCSASYHKQISTEILEKHYVKHHKDQHSIVGVLKAESTTIYNETLHNKVAQTFALLNWPLHHINSKHFRDLVDHLRSSSKSLPHRITLREKTLSLSKEYRQR
jgi:hypothetical protein